MTLKSLTIFVLQVEKICELREDLWDTVHDFILRLRDINAFLEGLRDFICDLLEQILGHINFLIALINCNLSCEPEGDCSTTLLKVRIHLPLIPHSLPPGCPGLAG